MIIKKLIAVATSSTPVWEGGPVGVGLSTAAGKMVSPETAKRLSTAYRCGNIISDDVAKIPLQQFVKLGPGRVQRVQPDPVRQNLAYMVEVKPNRYQIPFVLKKLAIQNLLYTGDAYLWMPMLRTPAIYCLPSPYVTTRLDGANVVYDVAFDGGVETLPDVEMLHLMINSVDGLTGRSVLRYARETMGRRLSAAEAQDLLYSQGLMPAAYMQFAGELNGDAREKIRKNYSEAIAGSANAGRLAILDSKVEKFEPITISPVDAQFLESIQATDVEIANFFGVPLYKLNQGKQSYESNDQQNLDYLNTTLDPYLVQWEQAAQVKWLSAAEQVNSYWRFERNVILRTAPAARADYLQKQILSGQMSPNEARAIEDRSAYAGGDIHVMPSNMAVITESGLEAANQGGTV